APPARRRAWHPATATMARWRYRRGRRRTPPGAGHGPRNAPGRASDRETESATPAAGQPVAGPGGRDRERGENRRRPPGSAPGAAPVRAHGGPPPDGFPRYPAPGAWGAGAGG